MLLEFNEHGNEVIVYNRILAAMYIFYEHSNEVHTPCIIATTYNLVLLEFYEHGNEVIVFQKAF